MVVNALEGADDEGMGKSTTVQDLMPQVDTLPTHTRTHYLMNNTTSIDVRARAHTHTHTHTHTQLGGLAQSSVETVLTNMEAENHVMFQDGTIYEVPFALFTHPPHEVPPLFTHTHTNTPQV